MSIVIYAIGGSLNERMIGMASDPLTAKSLITLVEVTGGRGVSLHGHFKGQTLSGDCTLAEARSTLGC